MNIPAPENSYSHSNMPHSTSGNNHVPQPARAHGGLGALDTLELAPGKGLGLFRLGDTLWHIIDVLRAKKNDCPKVEISWDPENPHKSAVTVHCGPLALYFPPSRDQRLALIQVGGLDNSQLSITYEGEVLASPSRPLTRAGVARALGPTYAGDGAARLSYPGVSFELSAKGVRDDVVASLSITPREDGVLPKDPKLETVAQVTITPGRGATINLPPELEIVLDETTAQDLLLDLGPPLRKYWKEDERMGRLWGHEVDTVVNGNDEAKPTPCFWNYFQLGLDFLVVDNVVTKMIAYSNIPGTPHFQHHARCPWTVATKSGELEFTSPLSAFRSALSASSGADSPMPQASGGATKKKGGKRSNSPQVSDKGDVPSDAMVLDRSVEGGLDGVVGVGTSQLVGFDGLIVEVDEKSGGICAVQVWRDSN